MKTPAFRLKIALLSAVISGGVLAGFGSAAYYLIARQKTDQLDTEIRSLAARHRGWLANRLNFQRIDDNLAFIYGDDAKQEIILMLKDEAGAVLHASPNWPAQIDPAQLDTRLEPDPDAPVEPTAGAGDEAVRGGGRGWGGSGWGGGGRPPAFTRIPRFETHGLWRLGMMGTADTTVVIGMNTRHAVSELRQLRDTFLLALPAALAVVAAGGWIVAGRALRPLRAIATTAEHVTARGLDQRIPLSHEDPEITRVIVMLNRMMDRLESSFLQATRFSADASHELKTPLAIMQGELENALQEAAPGSREQSVFGNLLEETQRLKMITQGLLLLARADAGQLHPALQTVNLTGLLDGLIEDARILAAESRLEFSVNLAPDLHVAADPSLLRNALMNLLVNAVKYNQADGKVEVTLADRDGMLSLTLCNTGPGIPPADRERIFTRFHRVDAARDRRLDGVGLGLSLAREIIRAHGGELDLTECRPGWTCFTVRLRRSDGDQHG
jgi:heavy metal sensor kinase